MNIFLRQLYQKGIVDLEIRDQEIRASVDQGFDDSQEPLLFFALD